MAQDDKSSGPGFLVLVVGLGIGGTALVVGAVFVGLSLLAANSVPVDLPWISVGLLSTAQIYDIARATVTISAALIIGATLILAIRRQRTSEANLDHERARLAYERTKEDSRLREHDVQIRVDQERQLRERFSSVASQLGQAASATRLAGVFAIAALADDWAAFGNVYERQVCVDLLCAYVRMPPKKSLPARGEREVRAAIFQVIREHLQIGTDSSRAWQGMQFDFTESILGSADLTGIELSAGNILFNGSRILGELRFDRAILSGGNVSFNRSFLEKSGSLSFRQTRFAGSHVAFGFSLLQSRWVGFQGAQFEKSTVNFDIEEVRDCSILFDRAEFRGGSVRMKLALRGRSKLRFQQTKFLNQSRVSIRTVAHEASRVEVYQCEFEGASRLSFERTPVLLDTTRIEIRGPIWRGGEISIAKPNFVGGTINITSFKPPTTGGIFFDTRPYVGQPETISSNDWMKNGAST